MKKEEIMKLKLNKQLVNYVESYILPHYIYFDGGHNINHARSVIERSFNIVCYNSLKVNYNMAYVVAAYHDYGIKIERKNHAIHSGELLRGDETLKQWFSKEEVNLMAEAVEDHSTSSGRVPRNIYGKIVSDADKDVSLSNEDSLKRALLFSLSHFPAFTKEEHFENCYEHVVTKFGENGIVKFYLPYPENEAYLKEKQELCNNKTLFLNLMEKICKQIEE